VAKIRPIGDRVVVKAAAKEEVTKSGIVIPDTARRNPREGTVIAVGNGAACFDNGDRAPIDVREGDRILFAKYGGTEFKLDDEGTSCSKKMTSWRHWLAQTDQFERKDYFDGKTTGIRTMMLVVRSRKASTLWPKRSKRPSAPRGAMSPWTRNLAHRP